MNPKKLIVGTYLFSCVVILLHGCVNSTKVTLHDLYKVWYYWSYIYLGILVVIAFLYFIYIKIRDRNRN
mgnify:CR=1 FL=1